MAQNNILLFYKGGITSDLLISVLQIMENKMVQMREESRIRKKVYNVLVECLQNLYHHADVVAESESDKIRSVLFTIGKFDNKYSIITGNYILNEHILELKKRIDAINSLSKEELKAFYKKVLTNGEMSLKGGGALGMIDIARKTGEKLTYHFWEVDNKTSFFILNIILFKPQN